MNHDLKIWFLILFIFVSPITLSNRLPWSKITITSKNAHCAPQKGSKSLFVFTYKDNVNVDFIDKSKITSNILEIVFDSKKPQNNKKTETSQFKSIIFKDNVHFSRTNHQAQADTAQLFPEQQLCKLSGNVIITQIKNKEKDVPIEIKTSQATINLATQEVQLEGDSNKPVTTVIELENIAHSSKKIQKAPRPTKTVDSQKQI